MSRLPPRIALFAVTLACISAPADSVTRRLEIEIEPVIVLKCVEQIDYSIDTARILTYGSDRGATISAAGTLAASARMIEARFAATEIVEGEGEKLFEIDVENACSVRGLGRGEGFLVNIRPSENGMLENTDGDGAVAVRDARGRPGYGGSFSRRFSIPQQRIRLETPISIDIQLRVDLRAARGSGQYSSPVDGVFAIEVTAP